MVRFLSQHEFARPRERIEARFRERFQLKLAIAIREIRKHEEAEPIANRLVKRRKNARFICIARMPLKQFFRLFAPISPEIRMQEINHRPKMPPLFHIHLEYISQIVERRRSMPKQSLLLDRRRLRVALRDDESPKRRAMLARNLLPNFFAVVVPKSDAAICVRLSQKNSPAIFGHAHVAKRRPAL